MSHPVIVNGVLYRSYSDYENHIKSAKECRETISDCCGCMARGCYRGTINSIDDLRHPTSGCCAAHIAYFLCFAGFVTSAINPENWIGNIVSVFSPATDVSTVSIVQNSFIGITLACAGITGMTGECLKLRNRGRRACEGRAAFQVPTEEVVVDTQPSSFGNSPAIRNN